MKNQKTKTRTKKKEKYKPLVIYGVEWPNGVIDFFETLNDAIMYSDINTVRIIKLVEQTP